MDYYRQLLSTYPDNNLDSRIFRGFFLYHHGLKYKNTYQQIIAQHRHQIHQQVIDKKTFNKLLLSLNSPVEKDLFTYAVFRQKLLPSYK